MNYGGRRGGIRNIIMVNVPIWVKIYSKLLTKRASQEALLSV